MIDYFLPHKSDSEHISYPSSKFPLCSTQRAVWLEQTLNPDTSIYNISTIARIDGELDSLIFIKAFYSLPQRHDALRLRLIKTQGMPLQECTDALGTITTWDLSQQPDAEESARIKMDASLMKPFNLYENLWRSELLKVSDTRWYWQFCSHHLISDGAGLKLIIEDMIDCYNKLLNGENNDDIAPSYFDFIQEDSLYLNSKHYKYDLKFWTERYNKLPPALCQRSASKKMTSQKKEKPVIWQIEKSLFQRIKGTMAKHGLSILHFMYAVLACYLARSTGEEEIVIGIPVHNRKNAKQKRTMGMFSLVIPVKITIDLARDSFLDVMYKAAAELRHCYKHQRLPITEINQLTKLKQKTGRSQLFDITLSFELFELNVDMTNCVTQLQKSYRETMFPLSVAIHQYILTQIEDNSDQPATIEFNFDPNYFRREEIIALQSRLAVLTEEAIQSLDTPAGSAKILPSAERQLLLRDFNATDADFPREALIHQLFEQQAERTPQATALISDDETLSYAELNRRANRLAHHLLALGVRPDDRVALCAERGAGMIVALLAILKAGGAYLPLDPAYPPERLAFMLDDAAPVALLTQSSLAEMPGGSLPVILLDVPPTRPFSEGNPDVPGLTSANLAYVIYTSGTTGKPKGVMVEHRSVINLHAGLDALLDITRPCRVAMNAGIVFDASVQCWLQLLSGHALVMVPQAVRRDSRLLWRYFARHRVDIVDCTPVQLQGLLESGLGTSSGYQPRRVLTGGDAISPQAWRAMQQITSTRFINVYGPTECTVDATACTVSAALPCPCIGRPIANTRIYILDARGQLVPQGVAGEIHIGGAGVARGYLNRPELTAGRFIPDAFSHDPLARLYRTGDLGRWLPDGSIEFLGRNDFQLKLRGFRIEPGEIEARLARCPGVLDAVVIAREDTPGDRRLVAYLRPQHGARPEPADLRRRLAAELAEYMIPAAFVTLDAFPLTPNGKLDRKALPVPDQAAVAVRSYEAPEGELETRIAAIWQALLGLARVGRHDHFFELGGHSLLAIQLINHLSKQGMQASLTTLFSSPTLCDLAQAIKNNPAITESSFGALPVPLSPEGRLPPLFLVHETSGDPLVYSPLARLLPAEQPVYALQALGMHTLDTPPDSLEALASYHIQAIRRIQAHGPYHLAGWSLGGVIAREIAGQLINHGEEIGFLGMIDSFNPNYIKTQCQNKQTGNAGEYLSKEQEEVNLVINYLRHKMNITDEEKLRDIYALNDIEQIFNFCHQHQWLPVGITKEDVLIRINTQKMFGQLSKRYHASAS